MSKVIAVSNQKGGTGKTTTTVNLGIGLANEGKKVLLIDFDAQGSLTQSLGYPNPDELSVTISTLMEKTVNEQPVAKDEGILHHAEGVDFIPANIELSGMETALVNIMSRERVLKNYLSQVKDNYDYVLIDCTPSLGMLTVNALTAANEVIIPVQSHFLPAKGLEQLLRTIAKVKRQINPQLKINGILLTTATCIGVTSLIFAAQGNVWAPILMTIFCIQYAIISYRFRYWGEMFTYLFMSLPMSVWSIVTWLKNAKNSSDGIVEIRKITRKGAGVLVLCNVAVTIAFYILLKKLNTPNLIFSTISVVTSFFAASLTMLRSSYYALGYASNDIVLIILWILASIKDPGYIPVVVNFLIFFLNDMYGFICWKKRETAQR